MVTLPCFNASTLQRSNAPTLQRSNAPTPLRFRASSSSIFPSGRQFITSAFVSQPLRATPIPNHNSWSRPSGARPG